MLIKKKLLNIGSNVSARATKMIVLNSEQEREKRQNCELHKIINGLCVPYVCLRICKFAWSPDNGHDKILTHMGNL